MIRSIASRSRRNRNPVALIACTLFASMAMVGGLFSFQVTLRLPSQGLARITSRTFGELLKRETRIDVMLDSLLLALSGKTRVSWPARA